MKLTRIVGAIGRVLMTLGVLILGFVAYQLWGTGIHEAQAQRELSEQLDAVLAAAATTSTSLATPAPTVTAAAVTAPADGIVPEIGEPVGRIEIPAIHVRKTFVQGDSLVQLDRAPGHYPATPFPGQAGNAAIAGHRTTYGAPFFHVDRLEPGDKIVTTTAQGRFTYSVTKVFIVDPEDTWVLDPDPEHPNTLTLTACHPRYSLAERIVVRAVLDGEPVPELPGQAEAQARAAAQSGEANSATLADGFASSGRSAAIWQTVAWGLICAVIWFAAWLAARTWRARAAAAAPAGAAPGGAGDLGGVGEAEAHRPSASAPPASQQPRRKGARGLRIRPGWHRVVVPYAVALPVFALALFWFYDHLAKVLPAGL